MLSTNSRTVTVLWNVPGYRRNRLSLNAILSFSLGDIAYLLDALINTR